MVSRRSVLAGGAVLGVSAAAGLTYAAGRADDVLGAVGVEPKALPDPGDQRLAEQARAQLDALVVLAAGAPASVIAALQAQAAALPAAPTPVAALDGTVVDACRTQAEARAAEVEQAVSPDVAVLLASLAAGLDQCAVAAT